MPGYIQIEGDPTRWWFEQSIDVGGLAEQALSIQVHAPLVGTLVLSPKAGSVLVVEQGSVPTALNNPHPVIYVPTPGGPSAASPGHDLPSSVNLSNLASQLAAAMRGGSRQSVALASGTLVLNGAALAFVVVAPPNPPAVGDSVPHD
jgi:hypothetical protein